MLNFEKTLTQLAVGPLGPDFALQTMLGGGDPSHESVAEYSGNTVLNKCMLFNIKASNIS